MNCEASTVCGRQVGRWKEIGFNLRTKTIAKIELSITIYLFLDLAETPTVTLQDRIYFIFYRENSNTLDQNI